MESVRIPYPILKHIRNLDYTVNEVGYSSAQVMVFDQFVLKIEKESIDSDNEHRMLKWLQGKLPVPELVVSYKEKGYNYLLMEKLKGRMACAEQYLEKPEKLISMLAESLQMLWQVDISDCPGINGVTQKLDLAKFYLEHELFDIENTEPDTFGPKGFEYPDKLLEFLVGNKPEETFVFSHGDCCLPNLLFYQGKISGFIDLGRSGVADRWQDIALCLRSLQNNLQTDCYNKTLLKELGLPFNEKKYRYYLLLDELF